MPISGEKLISFYQVDATK